MHLSTMDFEGGSVEYIMTSRRYSLRGFDGVMYIMDSALHCQVGSSLPLRLGRLISRITNMATKNKYRPPMLLILDTNSKVTENVTSRGEHFERLIASLHRLDTITLRGLGGSAAAQPPYNWWRVCRLHQQCGMLVNLNEAFQMAALQIASIAAEGSGHGQNVSADSPAM